jgi:hypothetical protein
LPIDGCFNGSAVPPFRRHNIIRRRKKKKKKERDKEKLGNVPVAQKFRPFW